MKIELTLDQYNKLRRLSDFADWYIDDKEPSFYGDYENDKEDITQAQEVIQEIDSQIHDDWLRQTNKAIREDV
jgi:hypothetical protein